MRIVSIESFLLPPRWLLVKISTDEGIEGWGEPVVEGRAETVRAAVGELADYLIGQDPLRITDHWQVLSKGGFYRGGAVLASAVAGLDQALWDIAGKHRGAPVHELLGGAVRDRVRTYAHAGGDSAEESADNAKRLVEAGYGAVKLGPLGATGLLDTPRHLDLEVGRVAAVREAIGDAHDLALDLHGRYSLPHARRLLREVEPLRPLFVEEPVLPEYTGLIGEAVRATTVPIATGERLYSRTDFLPALTAGIAVAQPDLSHAGGITECLRIAALAETFDVALAPHCPLGPVALAACLQLALAIPNFLIQEQVLGLHAPGSAPGLEYLVDTSPFALRDGCVERLTGPGLGITIDEAAVRRCSAGGHRFRSPVLRHPDGSFAEW